MSITQYTFEDADSQDFGSYTTFDYADALEHAHHYGLRIIENVYEWVDSEMVADFSERVR